MFNKIKAFFESEISADDEALSEDKINLAAAALMIEVATIDQRYDETEFAALKTILLEHYKIEASEFETLAALARQESEDSTSIYQFTQLLNEHCSYEDKYKLVRCLWTIAYADGALDKYEEYIVRKTSELLYLSHSDFIRAKLEVRDE